MKYRVRHNNSASVISMVKSLSIGLKNIVGVAAIGLALLLPSRSWAEATLWSSFRDIVDPVIPESFRGSYASSNSSLLSNRVSGILYMVTPGFNHIPIGGFDIKNGEVIQSYFANTGEAYAANTSEAPLIPENMYWQVFYDANGDGNYGLLVDGYLFMDRNEQLYLSDFSISNFTPYGSENPGNFTFTYTPAQEPPTGKVALGEQIVLRTSGLENVVNIPVNISSDLIDKAIILMARDELSQGDWQDVGIYTATNSTTVVSETNTVSRRFYKVRINDENP